MDCTKLVMCYETTFAILHCMIVLIYCRKFSFFFWSVVNIISRRWIRYDDQALHVGGGATRKTMILSNKFAFTTHAYENIHHMTLLHKLYNAKNEFISILVLFTSNLA